MDSTRCRNSATRNFCVRSGFILWSQSKGVNTLSIMRNILYLAFVLFLLPVSALQAGDLTLKVTEKTPPKEISPALQQELQPKAIQLLNGDQPAFEFWFVKEVGLKSAPASPDKALNAIKEMAFLGAVAVSTEGRRDYKDNEIPTGVYTMRFGLQPQDGDHLGTADFSTFAILVSAKYDSKPDAFANFKALTKASSKDTSTEHPIILNLRPTSTTDAKDLPKLNEPAPEHKGVLLSIPAKNGDHPTQIICDFVYQGHGHIQ